MNQTIISRIVDQPIKHRNGRVFATPIQEHKITFNSKKIYRNSKKILSGKKEEVVYQTVNKVHTKKKVTVVNLLTGEIL